MPCDSFEDRLLDYSELSAAEREPVDAHVAGCADCREYLDAAERLDARLADLYAGVRVSPGFQAAVLSRMKAEVPLARPSLLPEVLDFVGWAGVIGYRALYVDYAQGSGNTLFETNLLQHGPLFGISARF